MLITREVLLERFDAAMDLVRVQRGDQVRSLIPDRAAEGGRPLVITSVKLFYSPQGRESRIALFRGP
ncbi:hypothetical protein [Alloactinosynnema sp. L-07]|nr:hypothetical protein [Alloactinosynnema sp. L-07]